MPNFTCQRVLLNETPFASLDAGRSWIDQGLWPCWWITHPSLPTTPCWMEFRLQVRLSQAQDLRIHVVGDESYQLLVDGEMAGWGSERGTVDHWYFDTYAMRFEVGDHEFTARVLAAGPHGLRSQMSVGPAFLLSAETPGFSTGEAKWEVRLLDGLQYEKPFAHDFFSIGWNTVHDASRMNRVGEHADWKPAHRLHPGSTAGRRNRYPNIHLLAPALLPVTRRELFSGGHVRHISGRMTEPVSEHDHLADEANAWNAWWKDQAPLTLPPRTERRLIIDLEDYVCAWPEMDVLGGLGGRVQILWAESLFEKEEGGAKGNRAALEGKSFIGIGDTFLPDGSAHTFRGPFIRAGRYLQITVSVGEEPLVLKSLRLIRAEYPLETASEFSTSLAPMQPLLERCRRTVRASCHDNLIDGPYYEQMGWIGDTSQVALTLYSMSRDDRLVRKVLEVFDRSRGIDGMIRARWPARDSLFLPPYALLWINELHDFSWWRNEPEFVRARLPGMRAILDGFLAWLNPADGLLRIPTGWNFVDWVPGWDSGIPPRDDDGAGGVFQWQLAWALQQAAHLEQHFGEPELAVRFRRHAIRVAQGAEAYWNEARGLYADTRAHSDFSEHAQAYAVLSGLVPEAHAPRLKKALVEDDNLKRATDPFTHYLFEAFVKLDARHHIWPRLQRWFSYDSLGLLTTPEGPEPARSDCHAWGAHPHYHLFASLLGLRPASPGFREVRIDPLWDLLKDVAGQLPHPEGEIGFQLSLAAGKPKGEVTLPPGITGHLLYAGGKIPLNEGRNLFAP